MVNMNAATAIVITKSPYMARTSMTIPQLDHDARQLGGEERHQEGLHHGRRLRARHRRRRRLHDGFKAAGGEIVGSVRMAVANPDFSALRAARQGPQPGRHLRHDPGRRQPGAFGKALAERGIDPKKTKVMGQMEITDEHALASMGDAALGMITVAHYDYNHKSKTNEAFVKAYNAEFKRNPASSRSAAMTACTSSTRR